MHTQAQTSKYRRVILGNMIYIQLEQDQAQHAPKWQYITYHGRTYAGIFPLIYLAWHTRVHVCEYVCVCIYMYVKYTYTHAKIKV